MEWLLADFGSECQSKTGEVVVHVTCNFLNQNHVRARNQRALWYWSFMTTVPSQASAAVLQPSDPVPVDAVSVEGPNFDNVLSLQSMLSSYERIGFQATSFGRAIRIVDKMVSKPSLKGPLHIR